MADDGERSPGGGERLVRFLARPIWLLTRGLTIGACAIVHDAGRNVLLVRQSYARGWHLPGGGVERGETLHDALERELREEAAVALEAPARLHGMFSNHEILPGDHVAVFVVERWRQGTFRPTAEIRAAEFHPVDRLPEDVAPGARRRVAEVFDGVEASPHW